MKYYFFKFCNQVIKTYFTLKPMGIYGLPRTFKFETNKSLMEHVKKKKKSKMSYL